LPTTAWQGAQMANVQKENGYTTIANELIEALMHTNLSPYQSRIFWAIVRKTYGFHKKEDRISHGQFVEATGIEKRNIARTLKELEQRNLVTVKKTSPKKIYYGIQKDYEQWVNSFGISTDTKAEQSEMVSVPTTRVLSTDTKNGVSTDTYKRKKKIIQKKYTEKLSSKETLEAYLLTLPEYQNLSYQLQDLTLTFTDKIRQSNKTRTIAQSKVDKIHTSLTEINEMYGENNVKAGFEKVFDKEKREGFTFNSNNPTGYIRAVAKSLCVQNNQRQAEQQAQTAKKMLKNAPAGEFYKDIQKDFFK
jgi:phage replication O-like protein O